MHHLNLILTLTGDLTVPSIFGDVALRLGLSPIVGYLFAGIEVNANTPGFVANEGLAKQMAEIGVILPMLDVGRSEFSTRAATVALPMKDAFAVSIPIALRQWGSAR